MRSLAAGGKSTVRLAWAAASVLRAATVTAIAAAATTVTATPATAPLFPTLLITGMAKSLNPKAMYHAQMVNGKLPQLPTSGNRQLFIRNRNETIAGRLRLETTDANRDLIFGNRRRIRPRPVRWTAAPRG